MVDGIGDLPLEEGFLTGKHFNTINCYQHLRSIREYLRIHDQEQPDWSMVWSDLVPLKFRCLSLCVNDPFSIAPLGYSKCLLFYLLRGAANEVGLLVPLCVFAVLDFEWIAFDNMIIAI
ncbi:hypothetical protein DITRI_Ditri15bG0040400 [Diplodiscus trichospermus]